MKVQHGCNSSDMGIPVRTEEELRRNTVITPEDVLGLQKITKSKWPVSVSGGIIPTNLLLSSTSPVFCFFYIYRNIDQAPCVECTVFIGCLEKARKSGTMDSVAAWFQPLLLGMTDICNKLWDAAALTLGPRTNLSELENLAAWAGHQGFTLPSICSIVFQMWLLISISCRNALHLVKGVSWRWLFFFFSCRVLKSFFE